VTERLLRTTTVLLVLGLAGLAFVVTFEAISAFAVSTGAFPPLPGWNAPLLVDSFTAAAILVVWSRSRAGLGAGLAPSLVAAATAVSLALNVAHAPHRLAARLVAALLLALLAAVELVMSKACRALVHLGAPGRAGAALSDAAAASTAVLIAPANAVTASAAARTASGSAVTGAAGADDARIRVRARLATERACGPRLTGTQAAAAVGIKPRRAQELLRELRAQAAVTTPSQQQNPASAAGAP
jgi:hypothetical protein